MENLSILNHLSHPNILELLTSYTHDKKHNLVFPLAEGGTLADLLKTEPESTSFNSDETLLIALAGLSSGIEHVHRFVERRIDLSLIGCHHDLRPKNILVSKNIFILADFGLSRFKNSSENSKTAFKKGKGDYLAPECEDSNNNFEKLDIRRSSDIWSFGCIIAEVATYMRLGPKAVREFREKRKFTISSWTLTYFHCGQNQSNQSVDKWLKELENTSSKSFKLLLELVRQMLSLNEAERPKADTVTARLRLIAVHEVVESVDKFFTEALSRSDSFDALLEKNRFEGWKYAIGLLDLGGSSKSSNHSDKALFSGFQSILEYLFGIRNHLRSILLQNTCAQNLAFLPVCYLNDHLYDLLDLEGREKATSFLKATVVESDVGLPSMAEESSSLPLDREIRMRVTLKQMTTLAMEHSRLDISQRLLDSTAVENFKRFDDHHLGSINNNEGVTRQVLVEWRKHGKDYANNKVNQELFDRVNAIAKLLSLEKPKEFRNLHCRGFFHDPSRYAFGVVFDLPGSTNSTYDIVKPVTLQELIANTRTGIADQPLLEDRFMLAFTLAKAVMEFHMVGWLHKRLTSFNVAFFPIEELPISKKIKEPYIIGFNHSRPDDPLAFTEGFQDTNRHYQHPAYLKAASRYSPEFDYYSLGIVLLEIGLWSPLSHILPKLDSYSPEKVREKLVGFRIPLLGQVMGVAYREAVMACFEGNFRESKLEDEGRLNAQSVHLNFERLVVRRLKKCWIQLADCEE